MENKNILRNKIMNNRGFSLPLAILIMMLLTIGLAMFQTSIMSFATRTAVRHYELQTYLSARSVSIAIAEMIQDHTNNHIMAQTDEVLAHFPTLPPELTGGIPTMTLTTNQVAFIECMVDMSVGDVLSLDGITFDLLPLDFDAGSLESKITRTASTEYVITTTATLEGNTETVHVILNATEYNTTGSTTVEPSTDPEVVAGNANVFYSDYGFGLYSGKRMHNQSVGVPFIASIPIYIANMASDSNYYDQIQSYQEVYYVDSKKENGAFVSRTDFHYENGNISGLHIHTEGMVTIGSNTIIDGDGIIADTVYLTGDNIIIRVPIYARKLIIDGTTVSIGAVDVEVEELQVVMGSTGTGGSGGTISVNTSNGEAYWVSEPYFDGIPDTLKNALHDDSTANAHLIQFIPSGGISYVFANRVGTVDDWSLPYLKFDVSVDSYGNLSLPSTNIAPRSVPSWTSLSGRDGYVINADFWENGDPLYEAEEATPAARSIVEEGDGESEGGSDGESEGEGSAALEVVPAMLRGGDHYYIIDGSSGYTTSYLDLNYSTIDTTNLGEDSGEEQVTIVVQDGQTLYLRMEYAIPGASTYEPGVYIILQGNAKLHLANSSFNAGMRVFGDSASTADHETIVNAVRGVVDSFDPDTYADTSTYVGAVQDAIHNELQGGHLSKFSAIRLDNDAKFFGTCVIPYMYSTDGNLYTYGKQYPSGYLEGDEYTEEDGNVVVPDVPDRDDTTTGGGDSSTGGVTVKMLYVNIHSYAETVDGVDSGTAGVIPTP